MTQQNKPTVVVADDHSAILDAVCAILQSDFEIVSSVTDGAQALAAATVFQPDIAILDIMMESWNGFETASRIRNVSPKSKILFLSVVEDVDFIAKAREMNAGYVVKRRIGSDLLPATHQMLMGKQFFSSI